MHSTWRSWVSVYSLETGNTRSPKEWIWDVEAALLILAYRFLIPPPSSMVASRQMNVSNSSRRSLPTPNSIAVCYHFWPQDLCLLRKLSVRFLVNRGCRNRQIGNPCLRHILESFCLQISQVKFICLKDSKLYQGHKSQLHTLLVSICYVIS